MRIASVMVMAAILPASTGCQQPNHIEAMLGERASVPPPSNDGSCDFDSSGSKADAVFYVLGALAEYHGRVFVEDSDLVERFYCNETGVAPVFRRQLVHLAQEQGLTSAIRHEVRQDCLLSYHSAPIAEGLNSCFRYRMTNNRLIQEPDGTYRRTAVAPLGPSLFFTGYGGQTEQAGLTGFQRRRARAYLAGAWLRYGDAGKSAFVLANAQDKVRLIEVLLARLGADRIRVESTYGFIPQTNTVWFEADAELSEWLSKAR